MDNIKSPFNYVGGKYKLLEQIQPLFPKKINTFVDLFAGGCSVGINACVNKVAFNDNLVYLIELLQVFKRDKLEDSISYIEGFCSF